MQDDLSLHGDFKQLHLLGFDPTVPFYDLNLAGSQGVPPPDLIARTSAEADINPPTFSAPDTHVPDLTPHDLAGAGIDLHPAFVPDPALPDLREYTRPEGLTILAEPQMDVDPFLASHPVAEQPAGMQATRDLLAPDPLLPDLQHPELQQQVQMRGRPGDLDAGALQALHQDATYQQLGQKSYPAIFMDQSGVNSARSRHQDLLMRGLDAEER